jgi:hypothetical protein
VRWSRLAGGSSVAYRLCMADRESIDALETMLTEVELFVTKKAVHWTTALTFAE